MTRRLLTTREAAAFLGVGYNTIIRWSRDGEIPYYVINARGDRRFDIGDLDLWLLRRRSEAIAR